MSDHIPGNTYADHIPGNTYADHIPGDSYADHMPADFSGSSVTIYRGPVMEGGPPAGALLLSCVILSSEVLEAQCGSFWFYVGRKDAGRASGPLAFLLRVILDRDLFRETLYQV